MLGLGIGFSSISWPADFESGGDFESEPNPPVSLRLAAADFDQDTFPSCRVLHGAHQVLCMLGRAAPFLYRSGEENGRRSQSQSSQPRPASTSAPEEPNRPASPLWTTSAEAAREGADRGRLASGQALARCPRASSYSAARWVGDGSASQSQRR